jgi:hypothetical protein
MPPQQSTSGLYHPSSWHTTEKSSVKMNFFFVSSFTKLNKRLAVLRYIILCIYIYILYELKIRKETNESRVSCEMLKVDDSTMTGVG